MSRSEASTKYFDENVSYFNTGYEAVKDLRARHRIWTDLINRHRNGARTCLDIGCGAGIFSFYTAGLGIRTTGVDLSEKMLETCAAKKESMKAGNVDFIRAGLPFEDSLQGRTFDLILCSSVLEYVEDLDAGARSISDHLNKAGCLIVSFPNPRSLFRRYEYVKFKLFKKPAYMRFAFTGPDFKRMVHFWETHGFHLLESVYYGDDHPISQAASLFLPEFFCKNLFVLVLRKDS